MAAMKNLLPALLVLASCSGGPPPAVVLSGGRATIQAPAAKVTAVAAPDLGGRIISYQVDGEEILAKDRGFQLDIGPEMRQIPAHPAIWSWEYAATTLGTTALRLTSQVDGALGLRVVKEVGIQPGNGALEIVGKMLNVSAKDTSYCFWDRTLCVGGGWTLLPINRSSRFAAGWVKGRRKGPNLWDYDGDKPSHPNIQVMDGVLVVKTGGPEQKVGTDAMDGWIAYARGRRLFVKFYPCYPAGNYTDGGMTLAHYFRENVAELEPLSPEVTLKPGQEYIFPQMWAVITLDREVTSFAEARALVPKIPPSPFK